MVKRLLSSQNIFRVAPLLLIVILPAALSAQTAKPKKTSTKPATVKTSTTTSSKTTSTISPGNTALTSTVSTTASTVATTPAVVTETVAPKAEPVIVKPLVVPSYKEEPVAEEPPSNWINPEHTGENLMGIKEGWFIGADVGGTLFYGDVALYNVFPKFSDMSQSLGNGYSLYFGKKFKWGLSAEIQGFKGTIRGEKIADRLYPRYFRGDVIDYSLSLKYNLSQAIFREAPGRKFFNRFTVYITVGGGQVLYRSRLYKLANNDQWYLEKTNSYSTKGIDSASATSGGGNIVDKKAFSSAWIIPAGGKINFKLNGQTDLVLDVRYVTVFSDKLDSWERSWSHQDKYLYTGIGLNYNFGTRKDGDIPDDQRLLRPHKKSKANNDAYTGTTSAPAPSMGSGRKSRKTAKEDKDLEIKLKLYELQLKMFEMQYMLTQ